MIASAFLEQETSSYSQQDRYRLSALVRAATERGQVLELIGSEPRVLLDSGVTPTPVEQMDLVLQYLGSRYKPGGKPVPLDPRRDYPIAFAEGERGLSYLTKALEQKGWIVRTDKSEVPHYEVRMPGFERLEELRRARPGQNKIVSEPTGSVASRDETSGQDRGDWAPPRTDESNGETAGLVLGDLLGSGGFGEVYLHLHPTLHIPFAIKLFAPSAFIAAGDHALERFQKEAQLLFRLNHRNIVRVHDVGIMKDRPFIKMEYVDGVNLNKLLANGVDSARARAIIRDLASALAHAHQIGVVHRDIKPSNVMVEKNGRTVLVDFGLGILREDEIARLTRTGEQAAGGLFTAPELVANPKLIDGRTDIYSLGALWFQMLTGRPPAGVGHEQTLLGLGDDGALIRRCLESFEERHDAESLVAAIDKSRATQ